MVLRGFADTVVTKQKGRRVTIDGQGTTVVTCVDTGTLMCHSEAELVGHRQGEASPVKHGTQILAAGLSVTGVCSLQTSEPTCLQRLSWRKRNCGALLSAKVASCTCQSLSSC